MRLLGHKREVRVAEDEPHEAAKRWVAVLGAPAQLLLEERVGDRLRARDEKLGELERQLLPLR